MGCCCFFCFFGFFLSSLLSVQYYHTTFCISLLYFPYPCGWLVGLGLGVGRSGATCSTERRNKKNTIVWKGDPGVEGSQGKGGYTYIFSVHFFLFPFLFLRGRGVFFLRGSIPLYSIESLLFPVSRQWGRGLMWSR